MKKILLILNEDIFLASWTEKFNLNLAKSLAKLKYKVYIIVPDINKKNINFKNINIYKIDSRYLYNQRLLNYFELKKKIINIKPDIILSNWPSVQEIVTWIIIYFLQFRVNSISIYHWDMNTKNYFSKLYLFFYFRIFIKFFNKILFTTIFYKNYIFEKYNFKYKYIISSVWHNFLNKNKILWKKYNWNLLFTWRLDKSWYERKNPELLLKSC